MERETSTPDKTPAMTEQHREAGQTPLTQKKEFVEPCLSSPVDVLEATTFFQGTDSGVVP